MGFRVKATGGSRDIDRTEVRRALQVLIGPGEYHELRGLGRSASGQGYATSRVIHYGDWEAACDAAYELSEGIGVYYGLNPCIATLGDRAAAARHIMGRRWLLIDVDRKKLIEPDSSATQQEKDGALRLGCLICGYLIEEGWPAPVLSDSGNGCHLLFRIDLPADELARLLLQRTLKSLANRWPSPEAEIDFRVYDAPRIARLPGTWARKGISTDERPHRLCRLLHVPDPLDIVTVEMLESVAGNEAPTPQTYNPLKIKVPKSGDRREAYVRSAVERELSVLALTGAGNRNNILNSAAFAIGTLVGASAFDRGEAERRLAEAARQTGLPDTEIARHIRHGLDDGAAKPRTGLPEASGPGPKVQVNGSAATLPPGVSPIIWATSVTRRPVNWLVPQRIPTNKMTTFAGQTGMGKTFAICDLAARITSGLEIPFCGGRCFDAGTVLIISAEDDADDTLLPRFLDQGGDPKNLAFLSPEAEDHFSLAALDLLGKSLDAMGPDVRMIAIDPPTSYLGTVNDHKNAELRGLLTPIKRFCKARNVPVIFVTHVNKAMGQKIDAMARVMGSVAWVAVMRAAHMFVQDPEVPGKRLYVPLKVNNDELPKALRYLIEKQKTGEGLIKWLEEVDMTADEAIGNVKRKSRGIVATEWLTERFREKVEWESEELKKMAREAGISKNALWSPEVNALPFTKKRRSTADGESFFVWRADPGWPAPIDDGKVGKQERCVETP